MKKYFILSLLLGTILGQSKEELVGVYKTLRIDDESNKERIHIILEEDGTGIYSFIFVDNPDRNIFYDITWEVKINPSKTIGNHIGGVIIFTSINDKSQTLFNFGLLKNLTDKDKERSKKDYTYYEGGNILFLWKIGYTHEDSGSKLRVLEGF